MTLAIGKAAAAGAATARCLVVHDDVDLRARLTSLLHRAAPTCEARSIDREALAGMSADLIGAHAAVLLIVDFGRPAPADPLAVVALLRSQAPRVPILVFGRGGDERGAARSMKLGATDYWPIHCVKIDELAETLRIIEPKSKEDAVAPRPASQASRAADRWRPPDIAGYRLIKKIAQSAGATVYLAHNEELAQNVALKVRPTDGLRVGSEADRQRFARECKILAALNHRSIADVLDFGKTDEYVFLALEYFPCGSLRDRLKNPVSEADAVNYARQIGEALQIVHAAHIVHCDLKPSNLMLTDDNRVVLIDFGSARSQLANDLSRSDLGTGTPYYVCPEQIAGRDPDGRGDLYSLGVVLFEMLAGALPFAGKTLGDIFAAHCSANIPRLPKHLAHYQPIVSRLLAKDPADRYASARAFLDALSAASGSTSIRPPARPGFSIGVFDS